MGQGALDPEHPRPRGLVHGLRVADHLPIEIHVSHPAFKIGLLDKGQADPRVVFLTLRHNEIAVGQVADQGAEGGDPAVAKTTS